MRAIGTHSARIKESHPKRVRIPREIIPNTCSLSANNCGVYCVLFICAASKRQWRTEESFPVLLSHVSLVMFFIKSHVNFDVTNALKSTFRFNFTLKLRNSLVNNLCQIYFHPAFALHKTQGQFYIIISFLFPYIEVKTLRRKKKQH